MLKEITEGYTPTLKELTNIIKETKTEELFTLANEVKTKEFGNKVKIRGIIEFSNYCKKRCAYCGINCENTDVKRYRIEPRELIAQAVETAKYYKTLILQSGEDNYYTTEIICDIITKIMEKTKVAITLSIGERSYKDYQKFYNAGAKRYLLKHETANEDLYYSLHKASLEDRINCLTALKKIGYVVGGGFMVGLPNQTEETLAKDLLLLKGLDVNMAGIGPFIAHGNTQLKGSADGRADMTLKILALARLLMPKCNLPSTTALNVKGGMANALNCGANVIMQKATPYNLRGLYDIYPKDVGEEKTLKQQREELQNNLERMGLQGV